MLKIKYFILGVIAIVAFVFVKQKSFGITNFTNVQSISQIDTFSGTFINEDFLKEQKKYKRVRNAISEKQNTIDETLSKNNLSRNDLNILFVAYKKEKELDLYAKSNHEVIYKKIKTYKICSSSGNLGPKRQEGDYQVPEGFYYIDRFNPNSNYYLSLGLNYPNLSDKRKSKHKRLGGDIFIHGSCVTVGCLPMTDAYIKEIYLLAVYAKSNNQNKIPVYVFPFKMTESNNNSYTKLFTKEPEVIPFWQNIKKGHDEFLKEGKELNYKISDEGDYIFL